MVDRVITFGTFDLFHIGHLAILERAATFGPLVVGISTDRLTIAKKSRPPVFPERHRVRIVSALSVVDRVFLEHSLAEKRRYILEQQAHILVMGDDWAGRFDHLSDICRVIYLPRTASISTTATIETIVERSAPTVPAARGEQPVSEQAR
ncbi:adenylyltransferase/cytidyltransferase family protein [Fodinicola feengrottensis]|uniref:Adenylyltransferase/cytidyltransferase family protein n=1 Tax=Fodinicola feengrottensis TaxID=435914 RepID=A0ABN2GCT1_9ACTN|nr:adenylyltransferase/cytidyltransferase family protein [Fodinicola feengrottensis]